MSGETRHAGKTYLNKFGVLEVHQGTGRLRRKLIPIDRLDRVWRVVDRGELIVSEGTTHLRLLMHTVPQFGGWTACDGVHSVVIANDRAGEMFDQIVPTNPGAMWCFDLAGMQEPGASPLVVQELIIEEE